MSLLINQQAGAIGHPTLSAMLNGPLARLFEYREALQRLIRHVYGDGHVLLTPRDRRHRLELYKLGSLIARVELSGEEDVFELGYRCPEQLASYHTVLMETMRRGWTSGMPLCYWATLDDLSERIWQVHNEVKAFYQGLS